MLDNIWFVLKALINNKIRQKFSQGYKTDYLYQKIVTNLINNKDVVNALKVSYFFCFVNKLLYNIA
jgi:hypothetical protein